jgi:hypothetical protein
LATAQTAAPALPIQSVTSAVDALTPISPRNPRKTGSRKLTAEQIADIKRLHGDFSRAELSSRYHVSYSLIAKILHDPAKLAALRNWKRAGAEAAEIRKASMEFGTSQAELAIRYQVLPSIIAEILGESGTEAAVTIKPDATFVAYPNPNAAIKGLLGTNIEGLPSDILQEVAALSNEQLFPLGEKALRDVADDIVVLAEIRSRFCRAKGRAIIGYQCWKEFVERNSRYGIRTIQRRLNEVHGRDESKVNTRFLPGPEIPVAHADQSTESAAAPAIEPETRTVEPPQPMTRSHKKAKIQTLVSLVNEVFFARRELPRDFNFRTKQGRVAGAKYDDALDNLKTFIGDLDGPIEL